METLFWLFVFLCFYGYLGYPLLAWLVSRFVNRLPDIPENITAPVHATILVAAHNEERTINAKIDSLLQQTYPQDHFDVIVLSDGSTDGTVAAVRAYANPRIRVLDLPRGGKAAALDAGVSASSGEVIVFSDADNEWENNTLEKLLAPFQSEKIGAVSGCLVIRKKKDKLGMGDWLYRKYEAVLRDAETRLGSAVSADGGIFAIRRALYDGLPNDVTDDFYISTAAIVARKALVFQPEAVAYDEGLEHAEGQYRRRVRVTVRGMQSLWRRRVLMNPLQYGWYSFCLISHKLVRRFVPFFALFLLPVNLALLGTHGFYQVVFALQILFYGCAVAGLLDEQRRLPKPFKLAGFLLLSSIGLGAGIIKFLRGERYSFWTPQQHRSQ
ncbi:Glycosyl transferase, family 2 [gamma proteobacterium HdN1]|nr:Glycosyl transferase, family 2 [gamma proteobacterium HdN1]